MEHYFRVFVAEFERVWQEIDHHLLVAILVAVDLWVELRVFYFWRHKLHILFVGYVFYNGEGLLYAVEKREEALVQIEGVPLDLGWVEQVHHKILHELSCKLHCFCDVIKCIQGRYRGSQFLFLLIVLNGLPFCEKN